MKKCMYFIVQIEPAIIEEEYDERQASEDPSSSTATAHYDPIKNTTTITKRLSNGYQQTIKTELPEGQTKFETKIYLDPDTKDIELDEDLIDTIVDDSKTESDEPKESETKASVTAVPLAGETVEPKKMERKNTPSKLSFRNGSSSSNKTPERSLQSPIVTDATPPTSPTSPPLPQRNASAAVPIKPTKSSGLKVDINIPATPPAGTPPTSINMDNSEPTKILRKKKLLINMKTPPTTASIDSTPTTPSSPSTPSTTTPTITGKPTPPPRKKDPKKVAKK